MKNIKATKTTINNKYWQCKKETAAVVKSSLLCKLHEKFIKISTNAKKYATQNKLDSGWKLLAAVFETC